MVRRMGEAGATPEAIAIAMEEIEGIQTALNSRREADRDRKRAQRERQNSADVTGHSRDSHTDVTGIPSPQSPPLKTPPDPLKITPPLTPHPAVVISGRETGFHRLPEGWKPERELPERLAAKVAEWPPGATDDELESFHRWAFNADNKPGKGRKKDWEAAWHNWLDRQDKEHRNGRQTGSNRGSNGRMGGPGSNPTLQLLQSANAAITRNREDRGEPWPALPASQHR